ncbi:MAG: hypothetical protein NC388_04125 [Clostridium sp.]|nr:hypothetical protein [Clostridium sp.]
MSAVQEKLAIFAHETNVDRFGQLATTEKNAKYSLLALDAYLPNDHPVIFVEFK